MFVLICYDVPSKRTEIYKKLLKEFLVHEQASVFMGDLTESDLIRLQAKIASKIDPSDRILKLVCRNRHNVKLTTLSKSSRGGPMREDDGQWYGKNWAVT